MADTNLADLHPDLQPLCQKWLEGCKAQNLAVKVIQTWRDPVYQDRLYAKGRTTPGPIVTELTGSKSLHCCTVAGKPASKAFDFACFAKDGSYITLGTDEHYTLAGQVGLSLGLVWGGDWHGFKDYDHFELAPDPTFEV